MAFQSPFGDASHRYQRQGFLPNGGISIETGCITNATDTTFYVPTHLESCHSLVIETPNGSDACDEIPDVSVSADGRYLRCGITGTLANGYTNYVAHGY